MAQLKANRNFPNTGAWQDRHDSAILGATVGTRAPHETALVQMVSGWARYAKDHREAFDSAIADDYVLGPEWLALGKSLRALLNGNTGRIDCGTVDAFLLDSMRENGFSESETE